MFIINYLKELFITIVVIAGAAVGSFYFFEVSAEKKVQKSFFNTKILIKSTKILQTLWREGDYNNQLLTKKINCQKYTGILDEQKLKCNPALLICFLENLKELSGLTFFLDESLSANRFKNLGKNSFILTLKTSENSLAISFENSCRETYLPERIYTMEDSNERKYSWWDNFDRNIFIDKYLVTDFDIHSWLMSDKDFSGRKELLPKYKKTSFKTAIGLRGDEMVRYCQFLGKQLLTATLYDSASMNPGDYKNIKPKYPVRSRWPWSRKNKTGPVYEMRQDGNKEISEDMCKQVYSYECSEKFSDSRHKLGTPSWTGLFQILGRDMEYLENHLYFKKNLKASSDIFPMASNWNELGKRAYWDGTYFGPRSFNFRLNDPSVEFSKLKVGFRCYREIY